ncbi:GNAT family N-acetyltransferase [Asticcacaulis sp. BYS171W]|uniref:GNAT family N-acetyltransferase n=1 Tax=Asticcacaulis aquaticus TaxID=2984212 RepID=A0ABT5HWZ5_9CAUL|nr:GNAT family N-acetyltransferase [Asticcacaulis aquaticus]MDC7684595.1 GNAT family N-acetyltransferase [Asticcacaulis aquaticus]
MGLRNARVRFDGAVAVPEAPNRCWLTSLTTAIGPVAREEIGRVMHGPSAWVAVMISHLAERVGRLFRIDQAIYPDHRLLSTSLYTPDRLTAVLAEEVRFADRAVLIRSLNAFSHRDILAQAYKRWPFRVVWIVGDPKRDWCDRRDARRDRVRLAQSGLRHDIHRNGLPEVMLTRCLSLYRSLYIDAYSRFNPDYELEYIQSLLAEGCLEIHTLSDATGIVAVCALHGNDDMLTVPMVGYDRTRPAGDGLYRSIMTVAFEAACAKGVALNLSAGAGRFKAHRGAKPYVEYMIVIDAHLPLWRRTGYSLLAFVLGRAEPHLLRSAA